MTANENFDTSLQQKLEEKKSAGTIRTLIHATDKIDFSSNDYFGFAQSSILNQTETNNVPSGGTGSRSITGNSELAESTEQLIANFHNREAGLIFNTGYMANVGLFSCIASKGDTFISDEYIHASIIDGMRLSYANRVRFKHNDLADLEKKLQVATGKKIVSVESIYSMDGDEAPLKAIAMLCKKHEALLIVDEAHATGIYGDRGDGLVCKYGLEREVYASIHTFGKAIGLHGAVVVGSNTLRNYLLNQARSFIFTTALPPHIYLQLQKAYSLLPTADRNELNELISYFRATISRISNISFLDSYSPIQGIMVGDNFKTKMLANHLFDKGFFVRPILSPTVPIGKERIRICLHSFNNKKQIDDFLNETILFIRSYIIQ
ncbi:pyridoxal phosphate-dependent aminotransferase family protein [Ferruginibacter paludis]|uniref:aminotransferase class I/II-fold pyridoxal phosphate-dependent enzyme n=1 Tax=Ferruginibacter paludis TaxID=1310417 RepID=UPI0025B48BAB|nr:pyridoxal phosphate-dependent aminotransferase family protein [Ferruginibacter paludis]MDN3654033.1 pyridoxal phosphate-dependent aminotransferase family protein [Ferruginibacter paludis]